MSDPALEKQSVRPGDAGTDPTFAKAYQVVFWSVVASLILVDQGSKILALHHLSPMSGLPIIPDLFELRLAFNPGAAFSLFVGGRWVFVAVSALALVFLPLYLRSLIAMGERSWIFPIGVGLVLGGALGNAFDRIFRREGLVVDFFHVYWREHSFPLFNVADSGITIGLIMLLTVTFFPATFLSTAQKESHDHVADPLQDRQL